jgi:hypothetical protein
MNDSLINRLLAFAASCIAIAGFCLVSCEVKPRKDFVQEPATLAVGGDVEYEIMMGPRGSSIEYRIVIIDGQEYFATETTRGYWSLCPKIKPTTEKE